MTKANSDSTATFLISLCEGYIKKSNFAQRGKYNKCAQEEQKTKERNNNGQKQCSRTRVHFIVSWEA